MQKTWHSCSNYWMVQAVNEHSALRPAIELHCFAWQCVCTVSAAHIHRIVRCMCDFILMRSLGALRSTHAAKSARLRHWQPLIDDCATGSHLLTTAPLAATRWQVAVTSCMISHVCMLTSQIWQTQELGACHVRHVQSPEAHAGHTTPVSADAALPHTHHKNTSAAGACGIQAVVSHNLPARSKQVPRYLTQGTRVRFKG
jgi:hypothetical protein